MYKDVIYFTVVHLHMELHWVDGHYLIITD